MRLDEITNEDKVILKLKGVLYDFEYDFNRIKQLSLSNNGIAGALVVRANISMLKNDIELLLSQGLDETDPDIIRCKEIYRKLK